MGAPSGTVTFLFTDIEGSTRLWASAPEVMGSALERHDVIVRTAIDDRGGYVFATGGDGFAAAFARAADAVGAAMTLQERLGREVWPKEAAIRVRVGLHTGAAVERDGNYFGSAVNEVARLMAVGHGGQVLCSAATAALMSDRAQLVDLGEHRLRDLSSPRRVFQVGEEEFPPLRSLSAYRTNLPIQPSRFVGRGEELQRIEAALAESRLVTLTGVGGVGKTRLALQAAADALPRFADGVWLVELGALVDPAMVEEAAGAALGVRSILGRPLGQALDEFVANRHLLVVLDNCEHLIDAAAGLAARLVTASGTCHVLATSREGLSVQGERLVAVPPMSVTGDDLLSTDAVRLLVDRATNVREGFSAEPHDGQLLASLCRRLDGIPLAIELAAARVRSMTPTEILAHLDQRFRLLSAGRRTAPTRQQTLRSAIDWSHGLLSEAERALLRRCSVFSGGFDLASAETVVTADPLAVWEVVDLLDRLVDKSLLIAEGVNDVTRYRLLDTIRDYGLDRLEEAGETASFARRHARRYTDFSTQAGAGLRGPEEARWDQAIEMELENLQAALRWAIAARETDIAVRIVAGLAVGGPRMGMPFGPAAEDAANLEGAVDHPLRPLCLTSAAWTACLRGELDEVIRLSNEALASCRTDSHENEDLRVRSETITVTLSLRLIQGAARQELSPLIDQSLAVARQLGDPYYLAHALMHAPGTSSHEETLQVARRTGNPSTLSYALAILAADLIENDPAQAKTLLDEAVLQAEAVRNEQAGALARYTQVLVLSHLGGDHVSSARETLRSAEQLLASGERFWGLSLLGAVATDLDGLGAREPGIMVTAWVLIQGIRFPLLPLSPTQLEELVTDDLLSQLQPTLATMTDADVIALCHAEIDRYANNGPRAKTNVVRLEG
jgi:predicted ATPase/class 3 adenylate cyclase